MSEIKEVELLVVSDTSIFDVMNEAEEYGAHVFDDNGGDPDGPGPYLCETDELESGTVKAAVEAGARVIQGYKLPYLSSYDEARDSGIEFSGYSSRSYAYTTSSDNAQKLFGIAGHYAEH